MSGSLLVQDDGTTDQCSRCNKCSDIIVNCTCYDAEPESEHGHDANEPGFNTCHYETVELAYNSNYDDTSSAFSYLSTVSNFSALGLEFGPLDEEERTSDTQLGEPDMSDVLTSYFHDGNMTPPPSPEAQTNLWGVGTRDSSDSEKEPFVRTRKLKRTWDEYCQSPKGYEKMK
ncbi:uncharacterized protein H6S33_009087 [Morchella sextelata]|uniref:uncharacterized protein n=1 Tax=Morchella sextelata TaxID=1174677 RepID=UPI001D0471B6|nr:uncharacterized protein H6S33_009087 [Morchella sextelata]KAH0612707.1 hypothetical protein H6S33_009087 [Morchella sextelata]